MENRAKSRQIGPNLPIFVKKGVKMGQKIGVCEDRFGEISGEFGAHVKRKSDHPGVANVDEAGMSRAFNRLRKAESAAIAIREW